MITEETRRTTKEKVDLTGRDFGILHVIGEADVIIIHRNAFWKCRCTCGNIAYVSTTNLNIGYTTSCGCDHEEDKKH